MSREPHDEQGAQGDRGSTGAKWLQMPENKKVDSVVNTGIHNNKYINIHVHIHMYAYIHTEIHSQ